MACHTYVGVQGLTMIVKMPGKSCIDFLLFEGDRVVAVLAEGAV